MKAGAWLTGKLPSFVFPAKQVQVSALLSHTLFIHVRAGKRGLSSGQSQVRDVLPNAKLGGASSSFLKSLSASSIPHEARSDGDG